MGKKRTKTKPAEAASDRNPRKQSYAAEHMLRVVERLREQAARLSALAKAMDTAQVPKIRVDGHAMLQRGMNQIDNFIDNASRAVREAKTAKDAIA